jgi:hypothetical protein
VLGFSSQSILSFEDFGLVLPYDFANRRSRDKAPGWLGSYCEHVRSTLIELDLRGGPGRGGCSWERSALLGRRQAI